MEDGWKNKEEGLKRSRKKRRAGQTIHPPVTSAAPNLTVCHVNDETFYTQRSAPRLRNQQEMSPFWYVTWLIRYWIGRGLIYLHVTELFCEGKVETRNKLWISEDYLWTNMSTEQNYLTKQEIQRKSSVRTTTVKEVPSWRYDSVLEASCSSMCTKLPPDAEQSSINDHTNNWFSQKQYIKEELGGVGWRWVAKRHAEETGRGGRFL